MQTISHNFERCKFVQWVQRYAFPNVWTQMVSDLTRLAHRQSRMWQMDKGPRYCTITGLEHFMELRSESIRPAVLEVCIPQSLDPNGTRFDNFFTHGHADMRTAKSGTSPEAWGVKIFILSVFSIMINSVISVFTCWSKPMLFSIKVLNIVYTCIIIYIYTIRMFALILLSYTVLPLYFSSMCFASGICSSCIIFCDVLHWHWRGTIHVCLYLCCIYSAREHYDSTLY